MLSYIAIPLLLAGTAKAFGAGGKCLDDGKTTMEGAMGPAADPPLGFGMLIDAESYAPGETVIVEFNGDVNIRGFYAEALDTDNNRHGKWEPVKTMSAQLQCDDQRSITHMNSEDDPKKEDDEELRVYSTEDVRFRWTPPEDSFGDIKITAYLVGGEETGKTWDYMEQTLTGDGQAGPEEGTGAPAEGDAADGADPNDSTGTGDDDGDAKGKDTLAAANDATSIGGSLAGMAIPIMMIL